jgi:hypothetical protein
MPVTYLAPQHAYLITCPAECLPCYIPCPAAGVSCRVYAARSRRARSTRSTTTRFCSASRMTSASTTLRSTVPTTAWCPTRARPWRSIARAWTAFTRRGTTACAGRGRGTSTGPVSRAPRTPAVSVTRRLRRALRTPSPPQGVCTRAIPLWDERQDFFICM